MYIGWINAAFKSLQLMFSKKPEWVGARKELKEGSDQLKQGFRQEITEPFNAGLEGRPYTKPQQPGPVGGALKGLASLAIVFILVVIGFALVADHNDHLGSPYIQPTPRMGTPEYDESQRQATEAARKLYIMEHDCHRRYNEDKCSEYLTPEELRRDQHGHVIQAHPAQDPECNGDPPLMASWASEEDKQTAWRQYRQERKEHNCDH